MRATSDQISLVTIQCGKFLCIYLPSPRRSHPIEFGLFCDAAKVLLESERNVAHGAMPISNPDCSISRLR